MFQIHPRQRLCSGFSAEVVVPATLRSSLGDRTFPVAGARAWNALPSSVTSTPSLSSWNFSVPATTASITLITVSWSWNACTQHHVNPGKLNWTESLPPPPPTLSASSYFHLPHAHHSHPPSHIHCFIPGSKLTFSTNLFHESLLAPTWTAFSDYTGPDLLCWTVFHF